LKNKLGMSLALWVGLLMACGSAIAHHGNSAYDEKNPVTVKGTVTEFAWANPHVQIYFDVKDDRGNVAHWSVETLSPGKLVRCGWTRDGVKPGDQITVTVDAAKNGAPVGFLRNLVFADGRHLGIQESPQQ
jgi:hypothetical protein